MTWRKSQFSFQTENIVEHNAVRFQEKVWKLLGGLYNPPEQSARMISK